MREKSDASKLRDGRGILNGSCYEAWKTARESKSIGTACSVYDPIQRRSVNLLSAGERKVFWVLRFLTQGRILEQFPMDSHAISRICDDLGIRKYSRILSTDFVVEKDNGEAVAFSVKPNASSFSQNSKSGQKNIVRNEVEAQYWAKYDIEHRIIYSDDIDISLAMNIKDVMYYWDETTIKDKTSMLMHMIAHRKIQIPLDKGRIPFKTLAESLEMENFYESYRKQNDNSQFVG